MSLQHHSPLCLWTVLLWGFKTLHLVSLDFLHLAAVHLSQSRAEANSATPFLISLGKRGTSLVTWAGVLVP